MKKFLTPLAIALFSVGAMQASVIGTLSFADIGSPGSNTGDINTSTTFTIGNLFSTVGSGDLAGFPNEVFGPVTFDKTVGSSLSFSSAAFGTFTSTSISEVVNIAGIVGFYILGAYTPGTYTSADGPGGPASFTISYTQTPPGNGGISDSSTFSIPPAAPPGTPEPATMALVGSALIGLAMIRRRKA
jgi:hypothetical protein